MMSVEVFMFMLPRVLTKKQTCVTSQKDAVSCNCGERCTGYASQTNCPPLIVLAVLAAVEVGALAFNGYSPA
jgi:hypothetical protein